MSYETYYENIGIPFTGRRLEEVKNLLARNGLSYDEGIALTVGLYDKDSVLAATGSLQDNIIKCVAVADDMQGQGLSGRLIAALQREAVQQGHSHLFLFTKPKNKDIFSELGFYEITETENTLLMENKKNGICRFVDSLESMQTDGTVGAIVANCNPFTNGHLYLMEEAAKCCDVLHIFILSEEKSLFPADVRLRLVKEGTAHLKNVIVHPTSDYLISSATFPTYFLKNSPDADKINCELDLKIFCEYFASKLHITKRFVGTEPYSPVTKAYNEQMKKVLSSYGIEVCELERIQQQGAFVSASRVRALLEQEDYLAIQQLVPLCTDLWLHSTEGGKLLRWRLNH